MLFENVNCQQFSFLTCILALIAFVISFGKNTIVFSVHSSHKSQFLSFAGLCSRTKCFHNVSFLLTMKAHSLHGKLMPEEPSSFMTVS